MTPPTMKVLLWIKSPGVMMLASMTSTVLASWTLLCWWSLATNAEWMGSPSPQRYLATKGIVVIDFSNTPPPLPLPAHPNFALLLVSGFLVRSSFYHCHHWFTCFGGGGKMRGNKKGRRNNVLALGGCCFIFRQINQLIVGGSNGIYYGEDVQPGRRVWGGGGGYCIFFWGCKLNNETKKREEIMHWP